VVESDYIATMVWSSGPSVSLFLDYEFIFKTEIYNKNCIRRTV
jgi:hypothetical protein